MEGLIRIRDYLNDTGIIFWNGLANDHWPRYYGWLTEKLSNQDPFMVLTYATSFAVFFFLVYFWAKK